MSAFNGFADLDDLDQQPKSGPAPAFDPIHTPSPTMVCPKCNGRGSKTYGYTSNAKTYPCGLCSGTGKVTRKRIENVERFKRGLATRDANKKADVARWRTEHPEAALWIERMSQRGPGFGQNMAQRLEEFGSLTAGQLGAIENAIAKDKVRFAERYKEQAARNVDVGADSAHKILAALNKANSNGLKSPRIRTGEVDFSLAKAHSRNPGCAYVTRGDLYLGKINPEGLFQPSRECTDEMKAIIVEVATDPLQAAIAHGKRTGSCSCCGRELTDPVSIANGIGPICAAKYF